MSDDADIAAAIVEETLARGLARFDSPAPMPEEEPSMPANPIKLDDGAARQRHADKLAELLEWLTDVADRGERCPSFVDMKRRLQLGDASVRRLLARLQEDDAIRIEGTPGGRVITIMGTGKATARPPVAGGETPIRSSATNDGATAGSSPSSATFKGAVTTNMPITASSWTVDLRPAPGAPHFSTAAPPITVVELSSVPIEWLTEEIMRRVASAVSATDLAAAIARAEAAEGQLATIKQLLVAAPEPRNG